MGSSSGTEANNSNNLNFNEWKKYEELLAKDKISEVPPYYSKELAYLNQLFTSLDKKGQKSLELKDLQQIGYLKSHTFYSRIKQLFQEQMKKLKAKRINFELFLHLFATFHIKTDSQTKYKFIFRIYDWDKNLKIDSVDLIKTLKMILPSSFMQEDDYSKLASEALNKFGSKGQLKLQDFIQSVSEDEIKQILSFPFNQKFN